jgi:hypothetical protein
MGLELTHEYSTVTSGLVALVESTTVDGNDSSDGSVTDGHQSLTTSQHWLSAKLK